MVHDFGSSEATAPTLFASHAELAIHFATYLARYAESATVVFGDKNRFDLTMSSLEEIFFSAIDRSSRPTRLGDADAVVGFEGFATFDRDVGHLVDRSDMFFVEPVGNLFASESRETSLLSNLFEFCESAA